MNCDHGTVKRLDREPEPTMWVCVECRQDFVPLGDVAASQTNAQNAYETALDGIAGVMSAVMFDYTERMAEKHNLPPRPEDDGKSLQEHAASNCIATGGHNFQIGRCTSCGSSQFLGGE